MLVGKVFARSAKPCLDLVANEQHVVLPAKILGGLEVALWWNSRSANVRSRFCQFSTDVLGIPSQTLDWLDHERRNFMAALI